MVRRRLTRNPNTDPENAPIANAAEAAADEGLFRMWAGEGGSVVVYVWAPSFDTAFEELVEYLDDHAPGALTNLTEDDLRQAAADKGIEWQDHWPEESDSQFERVVEHAEIDLTPIGHTTLKHGQYIASWEWGGRDVDTDSEEWQIVYDRSVETEEAEGDDDDEGVYYVQGILGDRIVHEETIELKGEAVAAAQRLLRDRTFEGDTVRVLTGDGELVWPSEEQLTKNRRRRRNFR